MGAPARGIGEGVVRGHLEAAGISLPGGTELIRRQMRFGDDGASCLGEFCSQGVRQ